MKFVVSGHCLVPMLAEVTIEAETPEQAMAIAKARFEKDPRALIAAGTLDESAAFDWQPTVEPGPEN